MKVARALTIAGSDSGGGAGIQADLKTFTVHGVFGATAITALTAQNTRGVSGVLAVPPEFVRLQIDAVLDDIGADAVKTGMLANHQIAASVAEAIAQHRLDRVVVDPVMIAQSGARLLDTSAVTAIVERMLPLATIVTPNLPEAEALLGRPIGTVAEMHEAAAEICRLGARACLLKGGHRKGERAVDVLCHQGTTRELSSPWIASRHTHGTGCQLAAAITANLARGLELDAAVDRAKQFITVAIRHGLAIGAGDGPANPMAWQDA